MSHPHFTAAMVEWMATDYRLAPDDFLWFRPESLMAAQILFWGSFQGRSV